MDWTILKEKEEKEMDWNVELYFGLEVLQVFKWRYFF